MTSNACEGKEKSKKRKKESLGSTQINFKYLKFEYCSQVGNHCIREIFRAFGDTLEGLNVASNFYENETEIANEEFTEN